jgi:hypothetical protein
MIHNSNESCEKVAENFVWGVDIRDIEILYRSVFEVIVYHTLVKLDIFKTWG